VEAGEGRRARVAAMSTAAALGLAVDDAVVLSDSNRLVVRLMPCDVVARIAPVGYRVFSSAVGAARELAIVGRLAEQHAPAAVLERRVEPRVFVRDGFEITMWTYSEPVPPAGVPTPEDYAHALERLHDVMRTVDVATPHFTERVADVERWVARRDVTPDLGGDDRELLVDRIGGLRRSIVERGAKEQLLHGEPHPWNVLSTKEGPLFVDFENCVSGPVEFDLGWVPKAVSECYPGVDQDLVDTCRGLVLAMVAAHGWRRGDEKPGRESAGTFLDAVRNGPPWVSLDSL
jgi:aminoglycoside phosphotransferase (APT) family kinase protein